MTGKTPVRFDTANKEENGGQRAWSCACACGARFHRGSPLWPTWFHHIIWIDLFVFYRMIRDIPFFCEFDVGLYCAFSPSQFLGMWYEYRAS